MAQVIISESKRTTLKNKQFEKKIFIGFDKISSDNFFCIHVFATWSYNIPPFVVQNIYGSQWHTLVNGSNFLCWVPWIFLNDSALAWSFFLTHIRTLPNAHSLQKRQVLSKDKKILLMVDFG
jgi:hypothetical protein